MSKRKRLCIEVFADWAGLSQPTLMGYLYTMPSGGREIFSFEYSADWLNEYQDFAIDPSLQLYPNVQYPKREQDNFGVFLDSSPDRWGRYLMRRREAQLAREQKREPRTLLESDYLLGVYDENRMGGLRFRTDPKGPFLHPNKDYASPPWATLHELEQASLELEKDNAEKDPSYSKWLEMLIAPGSLGGARPKASVVDESNRLWIAKFPSAHDQHDIGGWEMVVHKLAKNAQINVSDAKVKKFNSSHHTFINKRFDRTDLGERIHFASAMTLLQRRDGDNKSSGVSYLELADLIKRQGARPAEDLEQLWRRIIFFICVSNVDDHLRNHGFILQQRGWVLSPAFDINPVNTGNGLTLNISEDDDTQSLSLAKSVAKYFRINDGRADEIIREIVKVVKDWRKMAASIGISTKDQDRMARAFRVVESFQ